MPTPTDVALAAINDYRIAAGNGSGSYKRATEAIERSRAQIDSAASSSVPTITTGGVTFPEPTSVLAPLFINGKAKRVLNETIDKIVVNEAKKKKTKKPQ